jgi:hypothetical protein
MPRKGTIFCADDSYAAWPIIHIPGARNNAADAIASSDTQITARPTGSDPVVVSIVPPCLPALKNVAHGRGVPLPSASRCDATGIQDVRDVPQCSCACLLCLSDDGQDVRRIPISRGSHGLRRAPASYVELGVTKGYTGRLCCCEGLICPDGN